MFKKLFDELMEAKDADEITRIFYRAPDGIDIAYQREKLSWADSERLFLLGARLQRLMMLEEQESGDAD